MKTKLFIYAICGLLCFSACRDKSHNHTDSTSTSTTEVKRDYKNERFNRRAYECAVWAQPLVSGNEMIVGAIRDGQKLNQVAYFSQPPNWKFQQPTPNNSTLYLQLIFDVKDGPVVVEIPAETEKFKVFGTFEDVWQRPSIDVGGKGADKGKGAKYFIYNKRDKNSKVPVGHLGVPLNTYRGYGTIRIIIPNNNEDTLKEAVEYIKLNVQQYKYGSDERLPHIDIFDKEYASVLDYDHTFFEKLQDVINYEEVEAESKYPMGMLASVGIEKGGKFNPTNEEKQQLDKVMKLIHEEYQHSIRYITAKRWGDKNQWTLPVAPSMIETKMTYEDANKIYVDDKAFTFYMYISPPLHLGKATAYLKVSQDKMGENLKGNKSYKLTVPENPPVEQFWSVLAYDMSTASYIKNSAPIGLASTESPKLDDDGSCDIYFGPEKKDNWDNYIPTGNAEDYFLLFRFYGPKEAYHNNTWMLNDMIEIK